MINLTISPTDIGTATNSLAEQAIAAENSPQYYYYSQSHDLKHYTNKKNFLATLLITPNPSPTLISCVSIPHTLGCTETSMVKHVLTI